MSFELAYQGECSVVESFRSKDHLGKDDFPAQMDALADEMQGLYQQMILCRQKMEELAQQAVKQSSPENVAVVFSPGGDLEVDDESVDITDSWWDQASSDQTFQDQSIREWCESGWCLQRRTRRKGRYSLKVAEGWDFHLENLEWKDDCLLYDGERVENDYEGSQCVEQVVQLKFPSCPAFSDHINLEQD